MTEEKIVAQLGLSESAFIGRWLEERLRLVVVRLATRCMLRAKHIELDAGAFSDLEEVAGNNKAIVMGLRGIALYVLGEKIDLGFRPGVIDGIAVFTAQDWVDPGKTVKFPVKVWDSENEH